MVSPNLKKESVGWLVNYLGKHHEVQKLHNQKHAKQEANGVLYVFVQNKQQNTFHLKYSVYDHF